MVLHGIALHLMILHSPSCHCIVSYGVAGYCIVGFGARAVSRKTPTYFILYNADIHLHTIIVLQYNRIQNTQTSNIVNIHSVYTIVYFSSPHSVLYCTKFTIVGVSIMLLSDLLASESNALHSLERHFLLLLVEPA